MLGVESWFAHRPVDDGVPNDFEKVITLYEELDAARFANVRKVRPLCPSSLVRVVIRPIIAQKSLSELMPKSD